MTATRAEKSRLPGHPGWISSSLGIGASLAFCPPQRMLGKHASGSRERTRACQERKHAAECRDVGMRATQGIWHLPWNVKGGWRDMADSCPKLRRRWLCGRRWEQGEAGSWLGGGEDTAHSPTAQIPTCPVERGQTWTSESGPLPDGEEVTTTHEPSWGWAATGG